MEGRLSLCRRKTINDLKCHTDSKQLNSQVSLTIEFFLQHTRRETSVWLVVRQITREEWRCM